MKKQRWLAGAALALMVALSACGNANDKTPESPDTGTAPVTEQGTGNTDSGNGEAPVDTAGNDANQDNDTSVNESSELPTHLPSDFPMPDDAVISTSTSGMNDGEKTAMMIFTTKQDMKKVSALYKTYFESKLSGAGQLIDDKNIVIQGTDDETGNTWSLIGGKMASQEGVIELVLTWSEK